MKRLASLMLCMAACGGSSSPSVVEAPAAVPTRGAASSLRIWAVREQIMKVPDTLTFVRQTACLPEGDAAFESLFTGGPAKVVTLRAADRRIDATFSCGDGEPFLHWLWVYPASVQDVRYLVAFTEAGVSLELRIDGAWQRICDERRCKLGLSPEETAFWSAQWEAIGELLNVSDQAVALDAAISKLLPKP